MELPRKVNQSTSYGTASNRRRRIDGPQRPHPTAPDVPSHSQPHDLTQSLRWCQLSARRHGNDARQRPATTNTGLAVPQVPESSQLWVGRSFAKNVKNPGPFPWQAKTVKYSSSMQVDLISPSCPSSLCQAEADTPTDPPSRLDWQRRLGIVGL